MAFAAKQFEDDSNDWMYPLKGLGAVLVEQGHFPEAVEKLERALKLATAEAGLPSEVGEIQFALARALWGEGKDRARALSLAAKAKENYKEGPDGLLAEDRAQVDEFLLQSP